MNNEQEWRAKLFEEIKEARQDIKEVKDEMNKLKIRVVGVSSFIGSLVSYFLNKVL